MPTISIRVKVDGLDDPLRLEREVRRKIKAHLRRLLLERDQKDELPRGTVDKWLREIREKS